MESETIRFGVLGPLEATSGGEPIQLGGTKQRAALGYLLLRPNRVVATSQLLQALWPDDDAPPSARKILQNAIWGLRRALPSVNRDHTGKLLTQSPGYKLVVPTARIDLFRFQELVEAGRVHLAKGEPAEASVLLRDGLDLWRGPVLADLAEADIVWPDLAAVEGARLDALEDYFEAQLACGRHQGVVSELETMVAASPLRERSYQLLMLALYRSGRQADALNVYGRARGALVDELGLEPGRDLQTLQMAILAQDPDLDVGVVPGEVTTAVAVPDHAMAAARRPVETMGAPASAGYGRLATLPPAGEPVTEPGTGRGVGGRTQASVLLVCAQPADEWITHHPDADAVMEEVALRIREQVDGLGGRSTATIGPISVAIFPNAGEEERTLRAVFAALAVRDSLDAMRIDQDIRPPIRFRAAIATGSALVRYDHLSGGTLSSITGQVLDDGQTMLARVDDGEIRMCARTKTGVGAVYDSDPAGAAGEWRVRGVRHDEAAYAAIPLVEREFELSLVSDLLERTRYRGTPHLVTIVGDVGIGKTRFLAELGRSMASSAHVASYAVKTPPPDGEAPVFGLQRELVSALCGIGAGETATAKLDKLRQTLGGLVTDPDRIDALEACLRPYLDPHADRGHLADLEAEALAWRRFLRDVELARPLMLLIDDLHDADGDLLAFVNGLADTAGAGLLIVASAHPVLFDRHPGWGGGKRHVTTLTLDPLSDAAMDQLLDTAVASEPDRGPATWLRKILGLSVATRPDDRRRYLRSLLAMRPPRNLSRGTTSCAATG